MDSNWEVILDDSNWIYDPMSNLSSGTRYLLTGSVVVRGFDFSKAREISDDGAIIDSVAITVDTAGISLSGATNTNTIAEVTVTATTPGAYILTCAATLDSSKILKACGQIVVKDS